MVSLSRTFVSPAKSAPKRNKGATVVMGGNVDSNNVTVAPSLKTMGIHTGKNGSVVPTPETNATIAAGGHLKGTFRAISGDFAKMTGGRYIMMRYTNYVANNAQTLLNTGAAGNSGHKSINYKQKFRTLKQSAAGWNYVTGRFLTTPVVTLEDFGNDDAGTPTRAIPGEFVITNYGLATKGALAVPSRLDYPAKTD